MAFVQNNKWVYLTFQLIYRLLRHTHNTHMGVITDLFTQQELS